MFRVFMFITVLLFTLSTVESQGTTISLFRQRTPRESILNAPNIEEHGIFLDWLKPHKKGEYRTNDTISLLRYLDSEFYGLIVVGSNGQKLKAVFDTAWSASWLLSRDCSSTSVGCWFHNKYDHGKSKTYIADGTPFNVDEGTYNLTGYYSTDTISFAHSRVTQKFVEMTSVPYWYVFSKTDGVIGLGLKYSENNPFFYNILQQTNITEPVFSIYLNRDKSSNKGGSISLGFIEPKHIHVTNLVPDNITYVPVNIESGLWEFNIDRITVIDGLKTYPVCLTNCTGLADTTGNSIMTKKESLENINKLTHATFLGFGKYQVNCATVNKLPFIEFVIGGASFNLTGKEYTQKLSYGPVTVCISAFTASSSSNESRWILGGAFLSKFYSIYDLGNKRMGFVRAA